MILGISAYPLDSAACLMRDGQALAAFEEERLTRVKHDGRFPYSAIEASLASAGVSLEDVTDVAFFMDPWLLLRKRIPYRLKTGLRFPTYAGGYLLYDVYTTMKFVYEVKQIAQKAGAKLHFVRHHEAHAASSFFCSPFEHAAILTMDYMGEWTSTWMGVGSGRSIKKVDEVFFPHSLGVLYAAFTHHLGFKVGSDEYKVMGLASYGKPEYLDLFRKLIKVKDGTFLVNLDYFTYHISGGQQGYLSERLIREIGGPRRKTEPVEDRHANIAASIQRLLEETVLHVCAALKAKTSARHLCLAGGVALNCTMNGRLAREAGFDQVFVQPASHDAGGALGAAAYVTHQIHGVPRRGQMTSAYLGKDFSEEEVRHAIELTKVQAKKVPDVERLAADLLAKGKIIGWFQGKMEWGPRALGNRSILGDPRQKDMKEKINKWVKFREEFRPFAPAVLKERAQEYFDLPFDSPFMLFAVPVRPEKHSIIPGVTHVDGTARVQTVSSHDNPRFYSLINHFSDQTGVPVILNTSFNVMGEPIVHTPLEAIRCFYSCGMDDLFVGDYWITKHPLS